MKEQLTVIDLALMIELMRNAQKGYFSSISKAKKTKAQEHFEEAAKFLKLSKQHELLVDDTIKEIFGSDEKKQVKEVENA